MDPHHDTKIIIRTLMNVIVPKLEYAVELLEGNEVRKTTGNSADDSS